MKTIGWVFVLMAGLIMRGMSKGRSVTDIPGDLGELFDAVIAGDQGRVTAALALTGESNLKDVAAQAVSAVPIAPQSAMQVIPSANGSQLLSRMKSLGNGKPYKWGAAGPSSYDCSGLVWAAMKSLGVYNGPRFTTFTFALQCRGIVKPTSTPAVGDIVVWQVPAHMGIVDGPNSVYSALNKRSGILSTKLSNIGRSPRYYRLNGPAKIATPADVKIADNK